ncbi:hypothetical protein KBD45_08600 [Candidatus Dojkabacteria bacterium]|nr:hypothetical protein [Candidatus Dojkabacteria bacterium]
MRIFKQLFSKTEKCKYIEYSYGDSSVPPEYHRSFVVHITKEKITIKVDSYGDIINDKSFKLSDKDFKDILKAVNKINFKAKFPPLTGCTGGVTRKLILQGEGELKCIDVYYCGNKPEQGKTKELDEAAEVIVSKIPNFQSLLKRT